MASVTAIYRSQPWICGIYQLAAGSPFKTLQRHVLGFIFCTFRDASRNYGQTLEFAEWMLPP